MKQLIFIRVGLILLAAVVFTLQGCNAVLTRSQVNEVATFAVAAKDYGAFPGTVIRSHADLRARQKLLEAATFTGGDSALRQVESAVNIRKELEKRASAADSALGILNDYAELLVKLTADNYTNELQGSAEKLGRSVDRGISKYNELRGAKLDGFGSLVASGVRGAVGIYIRHEQAEALKKAVTAADPVIETMIGEVEQLLALYLAPADLGSLKLTISAAGTMPEQLDLIRNVASDMRDSYRRVAEAGKGNQHIEAAILTANSLAGADDAIQLALKTLQAAETYRSAHRALSHNVTEPKWLNSSIDQVKALVDEVNDANRLKKKIESE